MNQSFDLTGRVALVTGAARGIGRAIATALAAAGATVCGFDRDTPATSPFPVYAVDIADPASVAAGLARLTQPPALLVNNAGVTRDRTLVKMSDEDWLAVLQVNLTGAFNLIRACAPAMIEAGYGRIVSVTSINGLRGKFGQANYTAAKAGLIGRSILYCY